MACPPSAPRRGGRRSRPARLHCCCQLQCLASAVKVDAVAVAAFACDSRQTFTKEGGGHHVSHTMLDGTACSYAARPSLLPYSTEEENSQGLCRNGSVHFSIHIYMKFLQLKTEIVSIQGCKGGLISEGNSPTVQRRRTANDCLESGWSPTYTKITNTVSNTTVFGL